MHWKPRPTNAFGPKGSCKSKQGPHKQTKKFGKSRKPNGLKLSQAALLLLNHASESLEIKGSLMPRCCMARHGDLVNQSWKKWVWELWSQGEQHYKHIKRYYIQQSYYPNLGFLYTFWNLVNSELLVPLNIFQKVCFWRGYYRLHPWPPNVKGLHRHWLRKAIAGFWWLKDTTPQVREDKDLAIWLFRKKHALSG